MITGRSPPPSTSAVPLPAALRPRACATIASSGGNAPRVDLAAKVFGEPVFVHDMALDGMVHARVVRQPRRGATIGSVDEAAIRRAAKGPIEIVRDGNFLAIVGTDETVVEAAAADGAKSRRLGRGRRDQPVPGRGAMAVAAAVDRPGHRRRSAIRSDTRDDEIRGDLHEDAHRPCLDRAVLRAGRLPRRAAYRCGRIRRGSTRCAMRWPGP